MTVATTDRVLHRNVGGNTTYTRTLYAELETLGVHHLILSPPQFRGLPRSVGYGLWEGLLLPRRIPLEVELIHYTSDTGALVPVKSIPMVATIHGIASLYVDVRSKAAEAIWRSRVARLATLANTVVSVSKSSAGDIMRHFDIPADRIQVIHHGVDRSRFRPAEPAERNRVAEKYRLPDEFFLFLGNLDPRKNVRLLVDAFDLLSDKDRTRVGLVVAGGPAWTDQDVVRDLQAHPSVTYLGRIPDVDVAPLLSAATAFVFPSAYEGFGLPVLEAMACGTAVVTTDRGALREVAADAALIVNEVTAEALRDALSEVIQNEALRSDLQLQGLANIRRFSWARSACDHKRLFDDLVR